MGIYYRHGRPISADTFRIISSRAMTGATEEDLWAGTGARARLAAAARLRLVSTSNEDAVARKQRSTLTIAGTVEDDVAKVVRGTVAGDLQPALPQITEITLAGDIEPVLPQITEITLAGAVEPLQTDVYTSTVGGNVDTFDVARETIDGVDYKAMVTAAMLVTSDVAQAIVDAINSGTLAAYDFQITGALDVGDTCRMTIGTDHYDYVCAGANLDDAANGLLGEINQGDGDARFVALKPANVGRLILLAKARGVVTDVPAASWTVDINGSAGWSPATLVVGRAACSTYTAARDGSDVVLTCNAAGTTVVVTTGYSADPLTDSTFTTIHTTTGQTADVAAVTDGTTTFQTTVQAGDTLNAIAIRLATELRTGGYTAPAPAAAVITVTGANGVTIAWADACTQGTGVGAALSCSPADTQAAQTADVAAVTDGTTTFQTTVQAGDTLNAIAIRLATELRTGGYTAPAPAGVVITVTGADGVAIAWADGCLQGTGPGAALTATPNNTQGSRTADTAGILLGGVHSFTHVVVTGDTLNSIAVDLASKIDAHANYACPAPAAAVFDITGLPGVNYAAADASVQGNGGGVPLTVTPVQQVAAATGDTVAVGDGTTTFSHKVTLSDATTGDLATALAAQIALDAKYTIISVVGAVITVETNAAGVVTAWADATTDNQTVDLTVTPANTVTATTATGITQARLDYLDSAGVRRSELVTLNGTTAVQTTATNILYVLGIAGTAVGSTGGAVGTVTVQNLGGGTIYEAIAATRAQSTGCHLKVPTSKEAWITRMRSSQGGAAVPRVRLYADVNPATGVRIPGASFLWEDLAGNVTTDPTFAIGPFPQDAIIWATGETNTAIAVVALEGYLAAVA